MLPHIITGAFFDFVLGHPQRNWEKLVTKAVQPMIGSKSGIDKGNKKRSDKRSAPLQLDKYTGNYHNPVYGKITIKKQQNKLSFKIGPRGTKLVLKHRNRDSFALIWPQTLDKDESSAIFNLDETGTIVEMIINAYGTDTIFKRRKS